MDAQTMTAFICSFNQIIIRIYPGLPDEVHRDWEQQTKHFQID